MRKLYKRGFLNGRKGTAFYEINGETHTSHDESTNIDAYLKIGDCGRVITLDFHSYGGPIQERIAKVDKLIDALTKLKAWLEEAASLTKV